MERPPPFFDQPHPIFASGLPPEWRPQPITAPPPSSSSSSSSTSPPPPTADAALDAMRPTKGMHKGGGKRAGIFKGASKGPGGKGGGKGGGHGAGRVDNPAAAAVPPVPQPVEGTKS